MPIPLGPLPPRVHLDEKVEDAAQVGGREADAGVPHPPDGLVPVPRGRDLLLNRR